MEFARQGGGVGFREATWSSIIPKPNCPLPKDTPVTPSVLENTWTHQLKVRFELPAHELKSPHSEPSETQWQDLKHNIAPGKASGSNR